MNLPNSHTFPSGISVGAYLMAGVSVVGAGVIAASPVFPPAPTPVQAAAVVSPAPGTITRSVPVAPPVPAPVLAAAVVSPPEPVAAAPAPEPAAAQPVTAATANTGIQLSLRTGTLNLGANNTGVFNTGLANRGIANTGAFNDGNFDIGGANTGDFNIGVGNDGDFNIGPSPRDWGRCRSCCGHGSPIHRAGRYRWRALSGLRVNGYTRQQSPHS